MIKQQFVSLVAIPALATALVLNSGCNPSGGPPTNNPETSRRNLEPTAADAKPEGTTSTPPNSSDTDHGHKPGAHGGIMISLGRDSYHVEAVIDSDGVVRLYTLGQDESRVIDVESQSLKGFVKVEGDVDSKAIDFEASPQEGDKPGKTSLFVGQLPPEFVGRKLEVTIPNIRIEGERFRLGFVSGQESHGDESSMPEKVADDAEQTLYLTPGGRYTEADIVANGKMTASQKFKGMKSDHDMKPKIGDRLCPISGTKANSNFVWIIDGNPYEFCCPPCVDEFLSAAKASTDPLPAPDSFIKK